MKKKKCWNKLASLYSYIYRKSGRHDFLASQLYLHIYSCKCSCLNSQITDAFFPDLVEKEEQYLTSYPIFTYIAPSPIPPLPLLSSSINWLVIALSQRLNLTTNFIYKEATNTTTLMSLWPKLHTLDVICMKVLIQTYIPTKGTL